MKFPTPRGHRAATRRRWRAVVIVIAGIVVPAAGARPSQPDTGLLASLRSAAPRADARALATAVRALRCIRRRNLASKPSVLGLIDYSRPSTQPRLWVFDLTRRTLLFRELVAHGRRSGGNMATHFSNRDGSLASSLGVFVTGATYRGHNGYSLRLKGLEPGFNDHASERAIVLHGAAYVDPRLAAREGRIGRSWGCPAVRPTVARPLIDTLRGGTVLVAYYPDQDWLNRSRLLNDCGG